MAKIFKVCCGVREHNGDYSYLLKKVKGEVFEENHNLCVSYIKKVFHLIDIATGLELNHFYEYEDLLKWYRENEQRYETYRKSSMYKDKVKMLKQLEELQ